MGQIELQTFLCIRICYRGLAKSIQLKLPILGSNLIAIKQVSQADVLPTVSTLLMQQSRPFFGRDLFAPDRRFAVFTDLGTHVYMPPNGLYAKLELASDAMTEPKHKLTWAYYRAYLKMTQSGEYSNQLRRNHVGSQEFHKP